MTMPPSTNAGALHHVVRCLDASPRRGAKVGAA
jgi:hypothetical protein